MVYLLRPEWGTRDYKGLPGFDARCTMSLQTDEEGVNNLHTQWCTVLRVCYHFLEVHLIPYPYPW